MSNDDRLEIDTSLVEHLIATQFPRWKDLPVRRVDRDGWDNSTFRLGEDMKVRLPTAERYVPQVIKEHRWLPTLAPLLPLRVPEPLALGEPADGYSWPWAIYRWLEGDTATPERINDERQFATDLAQFLLALQRIKADGPVAGPHSFFRGGLLEVYDTETRRTVAVLHDDISANEALALWDAARAAQWLGPAVWVHGDVAAENLIVANGRLCGVIDFGCCAVGDPACDLTVAWTLLEGQGREVFRTTIAADSDTWARARGWALWKALLTFTGDHDRASRVIAAILAEHRQQTR